MTDRRIRVLFIVPRFATIYRGVEAFVIELISRLDPVRFEITVLSGTHQANVPGVTFVQAGVIQREKLEWLARVPGLVRFLRFMGIGGPVEIEALSLLLRCRRHWGGDEFDIVIPLGGTCSYRFARKTFPSASIISIGQAGPVRSDLELSDIFVALTPHDELRARQMRPGMFTCIIPNGVDTRRFAPAAVVSPRRQASRRVILCAAALVPDKRHDLLFDAVMKLPDCVRVKCVGAGPHRRILEQHALVKAGRVEFCQHSFSEMPDVYREADVFSLASPEEAFGIVFVEAMAAGLPVVANDGPRQRYVVGGGGRLCDVYDSRTYAKSLRDMLDAAPSSQARAQSMRFDWQEVAVEYKKLFLSLCPQ